ncbi:hypothetical protein RN001_008234 [Aquatica leii]|uniref:Uncharacterized protein n=1 Tax=Aquatica leii TaxID=1421715 RepID=A0AAN7PAH7_9COLE|nr:hypothetical protein RN001_008234 [Aquatica leii]
MVDLINYIKNLIFPDDSRKRKSSTDINYGSVNSKFRKLQTSQMETSSEGEEWFSPATIRRRNSLHTVGIRNKPNSSKENVTLIIDDDDDDILEISKPKFGGKFSSTPNYPISRGASQQNGDDDVTFLKSTKSIDEKKLKAKKLGFDYIMPYNYLCDNQNKTRNNFKHEVTSPLFTSKKAKMRITRPAIRSSVLEQSFRLDEKLKYKELLAQAAPSSSLTNSFLKYSTPVGKVFMDDSRRGNKMVNLCLNKGNKVTGVIDLTVNGTSDASKKQMRTKDTIIKVLGESSSRPTTIKDSDSDIEILPQPPSPKPDIKVERVNSLKKIVDTSQTARETWLAKLIESHKKEVAKFDAEIPQRLEDQMVKCLKIKDIVLPVRFDEVPFPELSQEDELRIDRALKESLVTSESLKILRKHCKLIEEQLLKYEHRK